EFGGVADAGGDCGDTQIVGGGGEPKEEDQSGGSKPSPTLSISEVIVEALVVGCGGGGGGGGSECTSGAQCYDYDECTLDRCIDGSCSNPPRPNGTACDTGSDPCEEGTCQGGVCQPPSPDCNSNQKSDPCEIAEGLLADENGNGIPDICEIGVDADGWLQQWAVMWPLDGVDRTADYLAEGPGFTERNIAPTVGDLSHLYSWSPLVTSYFGGNSRGIYYESTVGSSKSLYAHTYLYNPVGRFVIARAGCNESYEIYVDGMLRLFYDHDGVRSFLKDQDESQAFWLPEGWHRIMVQLVSQSDAEYRFVLRFFDEVAPSVPLTDLSATRLRTEIDPTHGIVVPLDPAARPPVMLDWLVLGPFETSGCVQAACSDGVSDCVQTCSDYVDVMWVNGGTTEYYAQPTVNLADPTGFQWRTLRDTKRISFGKTFDIVDLNWFFDIDGWSTGPIEKSAYLHTYINYAGPPVEVRLGLRRSHADYVLLNGDQIHMDCGCLVEGCSDADLLSEPFLLNPGSNSLLIRIDGSAGCWGAVPRLVENSVVDPQPIPGVSFSLEPGVAVASQTSGPDCNYSLRNDSDDIAMGLSNDCQPNDIPDECEPGSGPNGIPDACYIAACDPLTDRACGDCNDNDKPDGPEIDTCDTMDSFACADCNGNGVPDECDITGDPSLDCDPPGVAGPNGILDMCEVLPQGELEDPLCASALPGEPPSVTYTFTTIEDFLGVDCSECEAPGCPGGPECPVDCSTCTEGYKIGYNGDPLSPFVSDYLDVEIQNAPTEFIWVTATGRGTVIKIRTDTGQIVGEYRTAPDYPNRAPEPTSLAVDSNGDVWVANSNVRRDASGITWGSVVKIAGDCSRCREACTTDNTSFLDPDGPVRRLSWPFGGDENEGVQLAEDVCIVYHTLVQGPDLSSITIDLNDDVWTGAPSEHVFSRITSPLAPGALPPVADPDNLARYSFQVPPDANGNRCGGYSSVITGKGELWSVTRNKNRALRCSNPYNDATCKCWLDIQDSDAWLSAEHMAPDPNSAYVWVASKYNTNLGADVFRLHLFDQELRFAHWQQLFHEGEPGIPPLEQSSAADAITVDSRGIAWIGGLKNDAFGARVLQVIRRGAGNADSYVIGREGIDDFATQCDRILLEEVSDPSCIGDSCYHQTAAIGCALSGEGRLFKIINGLSVAGDGQVWVVDHALDIVSRIQPEVSGGGKVNLQIALPSGSAPKSYGDATGFARSLHMPAWWRVVREGSVPMTKWMRVALQGYRPPLSLLDAITIEVKAAPTRELLSIASARAFTNFPAQSGTIDEIVALDPPLYGKFIEVRVLMKPKYVQDNFATPRFESLSITRECASDCNGNGKPDSCEPDVCEPDPVIRFYEVEGGAIRYDREILPSVPGGPIEVRECQAIGIDASRDAGGQDVSGVISYAWDLEDVDSLYDDASGPAFAYSFLGNSETVLWTVRASVETAFGTVPLERTQDVLVLDTQIEPEDVSIVGPTSVEEGQRACYRGAVNTKCDGLDPVVGLVWDVRYEADNAPFPFVNESNNPYELCFETPLANFIVDFIATEDDGNSAAASLLVTTTSDNPLYQVREAELLAEARYHWHDPITEGGLITHHTTMRAVNSMVTENVRAPIYVAFDQVAPTNATLFGNLQGPNTPLGDALPYIALVEDPGPSIDPGAASTWKDVSWILDEIATDVFSYAAQPHAHQRPPAYESTPLETAVEGERYEYAALAVDPEGDPIYYRFPDPASFMPPGDMSIDAITGVLAWTPSYMAANEGIGPESNQYVVTIEAHDGFAGSFAKQTFTIAVTSANTPPKFTSKPEGVAEVGVTYQYPMAVEDGDLDSVDFNVDIGCPNCLTIDSATTATLNWTPTQTGSYFFEISASDAITSVRQAWNVNVRECPSYPQIVSPAVPSFVEGLPNIIQIALNDSSQFPDVSYALDTAPLGMTIDERTGLIQWTPNFRQGGDAGHLVRVTAREHAGSDCTDTFTELLSVADRNTKPLIDESLLSELSVDEGELFSFRIPATDEDGDFLTFSLADPVALCSSHGYTMGDNVVTLSELSLDSVSGKLKWTPSQIAGGTFGEYYWMVVHVQDSRHQAALACFQVGVNPVDVPPMFDSDPPLYAREEQPYEYMVGAIDPDGQGISGYQVTASTAFEIEYSAVCDPIICGLPGCVGCAPEALCIDSMGTLTWTPHRAAAFCNPYTVNVKATDTTGNEATQSFELWVRQKNDEPSLSVVCPATAKEGDLYFCDGVSASDIDNDPDETPNTGDEVPNDRLSFALGASPPPPTGMTIDSQTGHITWLVPHSVVDLPTDPPVDLQIQVLVSDGHTTVDEPLNIQVQDAPPNAAPEITGLSVTSQDWNIPYSGLVQATDGDGDTLKFALLSAPTGMTIDRGSGIVIWPAPLPVGCHEFEVMVNDNEGGTDTERFTLTILQPGNDPPSFASTIPPDVATVGLQYVHPLGTTDPNPGDTLDYTWLSKPAGAAINGDSVGWTPAPAQVGTHDFEVRVEDSALGCASLRWSVTVTSLGDNRPPAITALTHEPTFGNRYAYRIDAIDPDGDALTYELKSQIAGMTLEGESIILNWDDEDAHDGIFSVAFRVEDGRGGSDERTFSLAAIQPSFIDPGLNARPHIYSQPVTRVANGSVYLYEVRTFDPDLQYGAGDPEAGLVYSVITGPSGMDFDGGANLLRWDTAGASNGVVSVTVQVAESADPMSLAEQTYSLVVSSDGLNEAPRIVSSPITRVVAGQTYSYPLCVVDEDPASIGLAVPVDPSSIGGGTFTFTPAPTPDDHIKNAVWDTTGVGPGIYNVTLKLTDLPGASVEQSYQIEVADNEGPSIISEPVTIAVPSIGAYEYVVLAVDPDEPSSSLIYDLVPGAPAGLSFNGTNTLTWPVAAFSGFAGQQFPVEVTVADGESPPVVQPFVIDVIGEDLHTPDVTVTAMPFSSAQGTPVRIIAQISDDTRIVDGSLAFNVVSLSGQSALSCTNTPSPNSQGKAVCELGTPDPGGYRVDVTVDDLSGKQGTGTTDFFVANTSTSSNLSAYIDSPEFDHEITSTSVDLFGHVTGPDLFKYTLAHRALGAEEFVTLHTVYTSGDIGSTSVPANLGTLQTTQLINGTYEIRLRVWDTLGGVFDVFTQYVITNRAKVGNLQLALTDLEIPMTGRPITVNRVYDSRNKQMGDFGYGWTLDVASIKVEENIPPGEGWKAIPPTGYFQQCSPDPNGDRFITVTWPDDYVETFWLYFVRPPQESYPWDGGCGEMQFDTVDVEPMFGATSDLSISLPSYLALDSANGVVIDSYGPWNPQQYVITTQDDTRFSFARRAGAPATITSVEDPNGNRLQFRPDKFIHTNKTDGVEAEIVITRDALGRIKTIKDLDPGVVDENLLKYEYDGRGDLIKFTNRAGDITRYHYDDAHNLIKIVGPDGNTVAHNVYDDNGRLMAHVDAAGGRTDYCHHEVGGADVSACSAYAIGECSKQETVLGPAPELGIPNPEITRSATTYCYDANGNVTRKRDYTGNTEYSDTEFQYDDNRLRKTLNPDGSYTERTYYPGTENVRTERDVNGHTTRYTYNSRNQVETVVDGRGEAYKSIHQYDSRGNLVRTTRRNPHGPDEITEYTYDNRGNRLTETDPLGHVTTFDYDADGRLQFQTDALGNVTTYEYYDDGNLEWESRTRTHIDLATGVTADPDPELKTSYTYDGEGRLKTQTDAFGRVTTTEYENGRRKSVTTFDSAGLITYDYDARGQLIRTNYPDESTTETVYDGAGRQIITKDRDDNYTAVEYDRAGRVTRNFAAVTSLDEADKCLKGTGPCPPYTRTIYDNMGRVEETYSIGCSVPSQEHCSKQVYTYMNGSPSKQIVTVKTFDVAQGTYSEYMETVAEYDGSGNLTREIRTDRGGLTLSDEQYECDYAGRRTKTIHTDGHYTLVTYDLAGRKIAERDRAGYVTEFDYDPLGRLTKVTDARGGATLYAYDEVGNLISQTDANQSKAAAPQTTQMSYDNLGNVLQRLLPEGQLETFDYYGPTELHAGALHTHTDFNNQTTTYDYDANGRLLSKTYYDQTSVSFAYTPGGLRTTAGGDTYTYDEHGHLDVETKENGDTLDYDYDESGNRIKLTVAAAGQITITDYEFDSLNRLGRVIENKGLEDPPGVSIEKVTQYTYDPAGNRESVSYPNGTCTVYQYDSLHRLTHVINKLTDTAGQCPISDAEGVVVKGYRYVLGLTGNRTRVEEFDGSAATPNI
ncbi:hypothetical protein C4568_03830, partial [Candidatus Parcubacteria bacterium]